MGQRKDSGTGVAVVAFRKPKRIGEAETSLDGTSHIIKYNNQTQDSK
jgi:hypothetical protein